MHDSNLDAIKTMLDHIEKIERFTRDKPSAEHFYEDEECFDATVFNLALIGEKTTKLSADFLMTHAHVGWRDVKDFRNFIIHNYDDLNPDRIWDVLKKNFPKLKNDLLEILHANVDNSKT